MSDELEQMQATRDCDMVMADFASQSAGMFTLGQVRWAILEIERLCARLEAAEATLREIHDASASDRDLYHYWTKEYFARWGEK